MDDQDQVVASSSARTWTRRRFLKVGIGGAATVATGAAGVALVAHGILPGKHILDQLDGACNVSPPMLEYASLGQEVSGSFHSAARNGTVGYTIGYPPGYRSGDEIPLVVMLHGFGADHASALSKMSPAQAVALKVGGRAITPMALVTVDGGQGFWHPHAGDDPMTMVTKELIPMCQGLGLGRPPRAIGMMGISMGDMEPCSSLRSFQVLSRRSPPSALLCGRATTRLITLTRTPMPPRKTLRSTTQSRMRRRWTRPLYVLQPVSTTLSIQVSKSW